MTVWLGSLKFAAETTSFCATWAQMAEIWSAGSPSTAAMAPTPAGTASCMNVPRARTERTASGSDMAPAATSAEYSPSEWPATKAGLP